MKFSTFKFRQFVDGVIARFRQSMNSKTPPGEAVEETSLIPGSSQEAHARLRHLLDQSAPIKELSHDEFMSGWIAIFHIAPALDPDEAMSEDGGWPVGWAPIATEAFRRFEMKKLTKEELYPHFTGLL